MTLESLLSSYTDTVLSELQMMNGEDVVHQFVSWDYYMESMVCPSWVTAKHQEQILSAALKEGKLPYQMAALAKEEMTRRMENAESELESAHDRVNWSKVFIQDADAIYLQGKNAKNPDYQWAYFFGEPYYEYTRSKCRGALLAYWDAVPGRVPRSDVQEVIFAKVTCLSEEYPTFLALMRLVNGKVLFLRHEDREAISEFHVVDSTYDAIDLLKDKELEHMTAVETLAIVK